MSDLSSRHLKPQWPFNFLNGAEIHDEQAHKTAIASQAQCSEENVEV